MQLHRGCANPRELFDAIAAGDVSARALQGLHLAPSATVAANYGDYLVTFTVSGEPRCAQVQRINKSNGNYNPRVGNELEVVLGSGVAIDSFLNQLQGATVRIPDGRVVEVDIETGETLGVVSH